MPGRIPQPFIDDLMTRVDIVEVIDSRVPLKRAGQNFIARCPFHAERTPSFSVSPVKQFYHCFGCGAHGTALGFLMAFERMSFPEAVEELAHSVGLRVPREGGELATRSETDLYGILEKAAEFYQRQLQEPSAQVARSYLLQRQLDEGVIERYRIGYSPPGWDRLWRHLEKNGARRQDLLAAGLLVEKDGGGVYDRFRERIMFPIQDRRGRVIAFGGRALGDVRPKYLNSPETPVFHKGRELYGLRQALQSSQRLDRLLVVEGYMDVVALSQHGISHAVATLGTATTSEHIERLFRITAQVVFCFDGDRAGRDAAWRALTNCLPLLHSGRETRFLMLPEGEDPDTLVRGIGREEFERRAEAATPLSRFFFQELLAQTDITTMEGRARLVELARPWLVQVTPGAFRQIMEEQLADLARIDTEKLSRLITVGTAKGRVTPRVTGSTPTVSSSRAAPSPIRVALALLLQEPGLARLATDPGRFRALDLRGAPLLAEVLELLHDQPHLSCGAVLEHWRGTEAGQHLTKLAQWTPLVPEAGTVAEFRGVLARLEQYAVEQEMEQLIDRARLTGLDAGEKVRLQELLRRQHDADRAFAEEQGGRQ